MSREQTRFNMDISTDDAKKLTEQDKASQKTHGLVRGLQPGSGVPDQF